MSSERESAPGVTPSGSDVHVVLLNPLEIHFSQTRVALEFQDGHTLEETIAEVKAVPQSEAPPDMLDGIEDASEGGLVPGNGQEGDGKDFLIVLAPFPIIEVIRWRCKLREPNGAPKLDPATGHELYSQEERWFTFDNRRLYCMQRVAMDHYPTPVRCQVIVVPMKLARTRELRKFDTKTFGCKVAVGRRDDPDIKSWSWRAAAGLPEEEQPECGVARQTRLRWRGGVRTRGDGRHSGRDGNDGGDGHSSAEIMRSAMFFFLVYLGLRLAFSVARHYLQWNPGYGGQLPQQPPPQDPPQP